MSSKSELLQGGSMSGPEERGEVGYALIEVFVAAAIAATAVAVVFSGLANGLRATGQAEMMITQAGEMRSIEAGLRAGMSASSLVEIYPDWQINVSPVDRPIDPRTGAVLTQATLIHPGRSGRASVRRTLIYVEDGALIRASGP